MWSYLYEKDYSKNQSHRLFDAFIKRNPHLLTNINDLDLGGIIIHADHELDRMGVFIDTIMLATWHWINPENGTDSSIVATAISNTQKRLREDFDEVFGSDHGVTVKPKGHYKFIYHGGSAVSFESEKEGPHHNQPKSQRLIQRVLNSEIPAAKVFFKCAKAGQRFCITKHKLGFENEINLEKAHKMMAALLQGVNKDSSISRRCTFMMDFDFSTDIAVGFDPIRLEHHFKW